MGEIIRTTAALAEACAAARRDGLVALDTEFVWKRTYHPQLGIVQLGTRSEAWAIDCMTAIDTAELKRLIEDDDVVKILHDARQDLVHLHHWTGAVPKNVFDTQLAAAFAGMRGGIGLQKLLFDALNVGLPKTETLTDWTRRPLSPAQVEYALDDVRYLAALRDWLLCRSDELGTLSYLAEDMMRYEEPELYGEIDPQELWRKIKTGRTRLDGLGRAVLRAVAALREELAQKWNLPRNWLGDDGSLVAMAADRRIGRLVHRLHGGQGDTVRGLYAQAIEEALKLPESDFPPDLHRYYIAEVLDAADKAMEWLRTHAETIHVDASVIASRATVTAFIDDPDDESNPLATGWRYDIVGKPMFDNFGSSVALPPQI